MSYCLVKHGWTKVVLKSHCQAMNHITHKNGGGVSILISSAITSWQKNIDLQLSTIELCLAEIKLEGMGKNLVIGSLYRPPKHHV